MSDPVGEKAALRKALLAELRTITLEERALRSGLICNQIIASETWRKCERVLLFSPHPGRIQEEFAVNLTRPRDINSVDLAEYSTRIMRSLKSFSAERIGA